MATISLYSHVAFSPCMCIYNVSLPIRTSVILNQIPHLMTSLNLNYLLKGPVPKYSPMGS